MPLSSVCHAADATPAVEFSCSGIVTFGDHSFHDQLILKITSDNEVKITGPAGSTSAFDAPTSYRMCSNTEDEATFEYVPQGLCGSQDSTRFGTLQKTAGTLKLSRVDRDAPFAGVYACHSNKPAAH